jgi:hypothetical protein
MRMAGSWSSMVAAEQILLEAEIWFRAIPPRRLIRVVKLALCIGRCSSSSRLSDMRSGSLNNV